MTFVDISGVDKVKLLRKLWEKGQACSFGRGLFDDSRARQAVKDDIDHFAGVAIKCDLSKDSVNPFLFDRDTWKGCFADCVKQVRNQ